MSLRGWIWVCCAAWLCACDQALQAGERDRVIVDSTDAGAPEEEPAPDAPTDLPDSGTDTALPGGTPQRLFVTRALFTADALGGLSGADRLCANAAQTAGLGGRWTAWLSSASTDAIARITSAGPWALVGTSRVVFATREQLRGYPSAPLERDEYGGEVFAPSYWTGTKLMGVRHPDEHCNSWTSGGHEKGMTGSGSFTSEHWTEGLWSFCNSERRLLCFEQ